MSRDNYLNKIALIGASGNVGGSTLKYLLELNPHIHITIVTRQNSSATFPSSSQITIRKGAYDDAAFLRSAFEGQDLVMLALGFMATGSQPGLIDAAIKAGVKWIIPNEYAGDGKNEELFNAVPIFQPKLAARKQIEDLEKTHQGVKWIGIATNPWTEFSVQMGTFGINAKDRTATFYSGAGPFNTSSANRVGLGIARLLSLPLTSPNSQASLQHYANNYVYISSFSVTQQQLFESIKRATKTSDADWTIQHSTIKDSIEDSRAKFAKGDMFAGATLTYAHYMGEGLGGDYQEKAKQDLKILGLEEENLDEVVNRAVQSPK